MEPPTKAEIDEVLNQAADAIDQGSRFGGMSYEEGVRAGIEWVTGQTDENPMAD